MYLTKSLFFLFFYTSITLAQTGSLIGKITDGSIPIPSANVILLETSIGTACDEEGSYQIKNIPNGKYQVRFSAVGYLTQTILLEIFPNKTVELNIKLSTVAIEVQTVEVTGQKQQEQRDTRTSFLDLNPRNAKILPGASEDVFRTLQSLPGVLAPNDFSSQLIVRGSGPDQNLIIMDDIEVFNPYRLYGVVSMFNPDAVADVNLISGGFPAKYGDRLSAVLDVTNKEGTTKKYFTGSINASIVDANVVLEGKNPFDLKGSWLINSRRTYYDLIIEPFVKNTGLVDENVSFPNFYDFQAKLVIGPYDGHKILLNGIYSRDGVNVVSPDNRKTADSIGVFNVTKNDIVAAAWHYTPNKYIFNKLVFSWYNNAGNTDFDSQVLDPSLNRKEFENTIPDTLSPYLLNFGFKADFGYKKYSIDDKLTYLWGDHIFEAGAGADFMETLLMFKFIIDPELAAIFAANPQFRAVLSDLKDIKYYNRYRTYLQNNFKVTDKFFFQPSLRFDYYEILAKPYLAPRLSFSYALDDITTLRGVWGIYYQSPGYEKLRDRNVLFDFNDVYTHALNAERAIHYVAGIERWLTPEWSLKLEGYYKDFNDLYVQKLVSGDLYFTEQIPGRDLKYKSSWTRPLVISGDSLTQIPINGATGEAYGMEILLSKKNIMNESKFSGWVSYSLAYANTTEYGNELPFRFDQRNTVNVVLNYSVASWLDIGLRWQYGSGFPYSAPIGIKPRIILIDDNLDGIPETPVIATRFNSSLPENEQEIIYDIDFGGNKLNARKPPYHRLDIRLNFFADYWGYDWTFYLDVINVYNRKNVLNYDYFITDDLKLDREATNMFPILPTLGFSVKF